MSFKPLPTYEITSPFQGQLNHISHLFCPLSPYRIYNSKGKIPFLITEQYYSNLMSLLKLSTFKYYYFYDNPSFIYYSGEYLQPYIQTASIILSSASKLWLKQS